MDNYSLIIIRSKQNPPNPPLQKGDFKWDFAQANDYLPPFLKGDRGGFYCAVVLPKTTATYSLYKQSQNIPPAHQVGFEYSKKSGPKGPAFTEATARQARLWAAP